MDAARGILQRRSRAILSRSNHLRSRVILSSSISTQSPAGIFPHAATPSLGGGRGRDIHVTGSVTRTARRFSTGGSSGSEPRIAQGEDAEQVRAGMEGLLGRGWELDAERMGIQKTFYFRTYFKAVSFVNVVASQSAMKRHHPTMTVRIGSVDVHWTTHHPRGLSLKDIAMAQHCEEGAELMGTVQEAQGKKCMPPSTSLGAP